MDHAPGFDGERSREAAKPLRFAGLVLDLDACILARDSGEEIVLTRGEFAVLRIFAARAGRVISRDTLLDAFANRRFEPFDRSVDVLIGKLRRKIEPDPKQPRLIVTVPGTGYRFDGLRFKPPASEKLSDAESASTPGDACPPRLSIVVLPFANIGGGADQEHFVDGVTESLTTDLSSIRGAVVIARNTAFTYKGKPVDAKTIGRELNVRYVLEGSVQRGGNRMRVNVQFIDAESGSHLWAERFDKPPADLFDMQDEIVARLANSLNAQIAVAEARRAAEAPTPDSLDLYFQGLGWFNRGMTPETLLQTRSFYERALVADPDNVDAAIGLAAAEVRAAASLLVADPAAVFAMAEARITKVLLSFADNARAHMYLGLVEIFTKRADEGIAECRHALALDRNLVHAHATIGHGKIFIGRAEQTEAHIAEALRLSPRDTSAHIWMNVAALAKLHLGSYDHAVARYRRAIEANRNYPDAYFQMAAALAHLGRIDEACSAIKAGLALNPTYTLCRARATRAARSDDPTYLAQLARVLDGMRLAGVPEG